jgi:hypothetical protein
MVSAAFIHAQRSSPRCNTLPSCSPAAEPRGFAHLGVTAAPVSTLLFVHCAMAAAPESRKQMQAENRTMRRGLAMVKVGE